MTRVEVKASVDVPPFEAVRVEYQGSLLVPLEDVRAYLVAAAAVFDGAGAHRDVGVSLRAVRDAMGGRPMEVR